MKGQPVSAQRVVALPVSDRDEQGCLWNHPASVLFFLCIFRAVTITKVTAVSGIT